MDITYKQQKKMKQEKINQLIKYLEDTEAHKKNSIADIVSDDDIGHFIYSDWEKEWNKKHLYTSNLDNVLDRVHHSINTSTNTYQLTPFYKWYSRVAAVLLIPVLMALGIMVLKTQHTQQLSAFSNTIEIVAPTSGLLNYYLPDSSLVVLNKGAHLVVPLSYNTNRTVALSGKGYFDVASNPDLPFIVDMKAGKVQVLGTKFTAHSIDTEQMEVILNEGAVNANFHNETKCVVLKPDERLVVNACDYTVENIHSDSYIEWINEKLVFKNEPFEKVCKRLSDWFNADIVIADKQLKTYTYRGVFKDESLEEVCQLMRLSMPIKYTLVPRKKQDDGTFTKQKLKLYINK